jgi:uncharacterized protein (TIGR00369 family)
VELTATDPDFERRVRASFAAQSFMRLIGARLERVEPGAVDIGLDFREDLGQQHGYLHAAVVTGIADSACGYAAATLMPEGSDVLSVEFKTNLLRPAKAVRFVAEARVVKAGRTLTVVRADVKGYPDASHGEPASGKPTLVATMLATMIRQ